MYLRILIQDILNQNLEEETGGVEKLWKVAQLVAKRKFVCRLHQKIKKERFHSATVPVFSVGYERYNVAFLKGSGAGCARCVKV